jgi:hypothetical protein
MVIVWGTTNAGKVDEVPGGMFHVVTRFGHLYYVPLIPTGSFVVLEKMADGGFHGAQIPLSGKSMLAGWLRGGSIVAMVGAVIGTLFTTLDNKAAPLAWVLPVLIGVAGIIALVLTYKLKFFTEASYERAKELAQYVGMNETGLLMLEVTYGRLSAEQADAQLARIEEEQARRQEQLAAQSQPLQAQVVE